ncbi:DinB family protein [Paeniglutamicibacter sp. R2-26]|uniref:DinB family protein n=1 Tax=Paeniglutamicibacter sp. R2-26 TaxID=3144417 RepID=UPI003EE6FCB1
MSEQPIPETKDWTWVLESACGECGQDVRGLDPQTIAGLVRGGVPRFAAALSLPGAGTRPAPQVWSPLEYCAHVADMYEVMDRRMGLILGQDEPTFANWDQDEAAVRLGYAAQSPRAVAERLQATAEAFAATLEGVGPEQLGRRGLRSNGSVFTAATLARYAWHDAVHHLHDLGV